LLIAIQKSIRLLANKTTALNLQRFFKTGKGAYGEGDVFLGLKATQIKEVVKKYRDLPLVDCIRLLHSKYHEHRMIALQILVGKFNRSESDALKQRIFNIFLQNTKYINNWDLVDTTVEHVIGAYLYDKEKDVLYAFANSTLLWERRIAIIATFNYIKRGEYKETLKIAKLLLSDKHDLIHKAVGWMLREVGKRCDEKILTDFLDEYATKMPRTTLRYSIERLPKDKYYYYLNLKPLC
jgi:3-methyladenine DNA glycosylase AlkD